MSKIIFVPVCENCGHEFTELEFSIGMEINCPKCGMILNNIVLPIYDFMVSMNNKDIGYKFKYNKKDFYE